MKPAAEACPVTAAMVGMGREMRSATSDLNFDDRRRTREAEGEVGVDCWAQERSKPLEKNLPWAVVMRAAAAGEEVDSALTRARAALMESIKVGFNLCSPAPVSVRMKRLPRFSNVHISLIKIKEDD